MLYPWGMEDGTLSAPGITDVTARPPLGHPRRDDPECPVRTILDRVGDKWAASVVTHLGQGTTRFSVLKRQIDGISQRMLTETLRKLERDGVLTRRIYATVPPQVEYTLTPLGESLVPTIEALVQWALTNQAEIKAARVRYDTRAVD